MFGSEVIHAALSLVFILAFVTLFASVVKETIDSLPRNRSKDLEPVLRELPGGDADMLQLVYEHPMISSLYPGRYKSGHGSLPSYIPSTHFSAALLDLMTHSTGGDHTVSGQVESLLNAIEKIENPRVRSVVLSAYRHANGDIEATQSYLENWFDAGLDMVSGWYRSRVQKFLFAIGLGSAVLFNINLYQIGTETVGHSTLHESFAGYFKGTVSPQNADIVDIAKMQEQLNEVGAPVGWDPPPQRICVDAANGAQSCSIPL